MMRAVAEVTRPYGVPTFASLNAIMVDGTGMCGGCRVSVGGKTVYACVDGPEFDAHEVDFRELADRLTTYREFETRALEVAHRRAAAAGGAAPTRRTASCLIPALATAPRAGGGHGRRGAGRDRLAETPPPTRGPRCVRRRLGTSSRPSITRSRPRSG